MLGLNRDTVGQFDRPYCSLSNVKSVIFTYSGGFFRRRLLCCDRELRDPGNYYFDSLNLDVEIISRKTKPKCTTDGLKGNKKNDLKNQFYDI